MDYDRLWPHQSSALESCRRYVQAFQSGDTDGSALVRMPTGTGKSGVIAVLAAECLNEASCLIVTPWKALRDQIARDVESRFWRHIGVEAPPLVVRAFTPSTLEDELGRGTPMVLACTHASLQTLHAAAQSDDSYRRLRESIGLVLVDEGHREPAPSWARAVRGLRVPCVLFSATPYRNDQKLFNVDFKYATTLTFDEAVGAGFVRQVEFAPASPALNPGDFVDQLRDLVAGLKDPSARVIVRCTSAAEVADIASRLVGAGETAVALHETFPTAADGFRRRRVPDPLVEEAQYWVHQFKLLEGIDDPRFQVLAVYGPLTDARAVVQQVGRIIRNPAQQVGEVATVLADESQARHWSGYLAYEKASAVHPNAGSAVAALQAYLEEHSLLSYYAGTFRQPFDPYSDDTPDEIAYRYSTNVLDLPRRLSRVEMAEALEAEYYAVDRHMLRRVDIDDQTVLFVFVTITNSPLLRTQLFFEYRLGYTVIHQRGSRVFVCDSDGRVPELIRESAFPLRASLLECLFDADSRLGAISLINTDVGANSVRRRTLHARSLTDTAPNLFDHSFFPSTARGYVASESDLASVARYVGFTRSRVSDHSATQPTLQELLEWIEGLAEHLEQADPEPSSDLFVRYAAESKAPSDAQPLNILLDLAEVERELYRIGGVRSGTDSVVFDDICFPVGDGSFSILVNGANVPTEIRYDSKKERYIVRSADLDNRVGVRTSRGVGAPETLTAYLNREQAFRIVAGDGQTIYAHSRFYQPRVPLGGPTAGRLDLLRVLHPIAELAEIESEKGTQGLPSNAGWPADSVFGLIDGLGAQTALNPLMADAAVLVCDDMHAEVADFWLGMTADPRVVLIHAKAGSGQRRSASVFHDLVGQALKNLEYLSPFLDRDPPNYGLWGKPWKGHGFRVEKRVRRGGTKRQAWSTLRNLIRNPSATREVWLILGAGFSEGEFRVRVRQKTQPPEDVQILYLLSALWSGVSAIGARLRVFCSP